VARIEVHRATRFAPESLEAVCVDRVSVDPKAIPLALGSNGHPTRARGFGTFQQSTKLKHVRLEGLRGGRGGVLTPDAVDQSID
jgi:hypothetical protein